MPKKDYRVGCDFYNGKKCTYPFKICGCRIMKNERKKVELIKSKKIKPCLKNIIC